MMSRIGELKHNFKMSILFGNRVVPTLKIS